MPANGVHIQLRVAGDAQGGCGFGLQRGLAALLDDQAGNALDDLPRACRRRAGNGLSVFAYDCDTAEDGLHAEITSLK